MDNDNSDSLVRVRQVHKYFRRGNERIDVLNGLHLDVPEGEFLGLMGPSGSGKTTLLNLIAGLDVPSEGEIWVGDDLVSGMSEGQLANWRTRHVGFIFQFYHLLPVLSVFENVELPLLLLPLSARRRREQVMTVLDLVGLTDRVRHRPGQLSGGQQQRVGIARAIVTDPTLIVADEPTGDLDAKSAEEILDLLGELRATLAKTILLVTHDPRAAARASRVLHLDKGVLVEAGLDSARTPAQPESSMKYLILIWKNLRRSILRSTLTALGTMVLVFVVTLVWSVLSFLQAATEEKSQNLKAIVTERWSIPSRMPFSYATGLSEGAAAKPDDVRPLDSMTWQFYGGTLDPEKFTRENVIFGIAVEPSKIATMLDGLEDLSASDQALLDASVQRLSENRQGIILGQNQLERDQQARGRSLYDVWHQQFPGDRSGIRNRGDVSHRSLRQPGRLSSRLFQQRAGQL